MHPALIVVLVLLALPLVYFLGVTAGIYATWGYTHWRGRKDPMDPFQERLFLTRVKVPLTRRVAGLTVEGFWQSVAFAMQGVHMVRPLQTPPLDPEGGAPVILIAGYLENSGQMWLLGRRLRERGYQAVHLDLPSTFSSVRKNADALSKKISEVCTRTGRDQVGVVVHSMSGLVARAYLHGTEDARVACLVTIASPHQGTHMAKLGFGKSARDMSPGSEWLRAHPPHKRCGTPIHTVISVQDNMVSPPWNTVLDEGDNVVLDAPVGHLAPLFMPEVELKIAGWLEAVELLPAARDDRSLVVAAAGLALRQEVCGCYPA